ncbi:MAG: exo-alpha-sialidase, partial [Bacteroidetes bacterium]|nr:exo-alpha-sialidase [Bacteroidota bacterium]
MRRKKSVAILMIALIQVIFFSCAKKGLPASNNNVSPKDTLSFSSQVYISGQEGYNTFRIPAIIKTNDGGLLAFTEGRVNNSADFGDIKILVKKSMDNGKTWSASELVAQNSNLQAGNPSPVVDNTDPNYPQGRIFLFYCTGNNTQANVTNLVGVREVWYTTSTDNGATWSAPTNITLQVHHPYQPTFNPAYTDTLKWTAYATGPGHALQLTQGAHTGRMVVPINHGIYSSKTNYAAAFYSDDHGVSFLLSPDVPFQSDETTATELQNGGVLLNSRDQYLGSHERILSYDVSGNLDGTTKWQTGFNTYLPDPVCEGSMINYTTTAGKQVLLFSNPV